MIASLALLLALPSPEARLGSVSEPKHVQTMHLYGQCIAQHRERQVRELLARDFRTSQYRRAMDKIIRDGTCKQHLDRAMRSSRLLLAGSFGEALLKKDGLLPSLAAITAFRPELPTVEARDAGELMGICSVRTNPGQVAALLETEPATAEEFQAIKGMGATFAACVPANSKSKFTREALRALLVLAAYRLALHNRGGLGSKRAAVQ